MINSRLKEIRKYLHLTQQEFANQLGIKRNTVATYETGKSNPSDSAVALICNVFNVNEGWLRTGNGEMFLPDTSSEIDALAKKYHLSSGMQTFISKLVNTKPEIQEAIIELIRETADEIAKNN